MVTREISVSWSRAERLLIWGGFSLLGGLVGWLLPLAVDRLRDLPVGPFEGLADLLDRAPGGLVTPVAIGLGALIGATLAGIGEYEALRLQLSRDELTMKRKDVTTTIPRRDVAHVFADGKRLVVLGPDGREQAAEVFDTNVTRLAVALESTGYPWRPDGDPFAADFRRWVPGMPGPPPATGPLLVARHRALERKDVTEAELLRRELSVAGVRVRDEKGHQFWRPVRS